MRFLIIILLASFFNLKCFAQLENKSKLRKEVYLKIIDTLRKENINQPLKINIQTDVGVPIEVTSGMGGQNLLKFEIQKDTIIVKKLTLELVNSNLHKTL